MGTRLESQLNFKKHVDLKVKKLSKLLCFLNFTRQDLNLENRLIYYETYVESIISYAFIVYGSTNSINLHTVFRLRKEFLCISFGKPIFAHSSRLFERSSVPTIHELYASALIKFFLENTRGLLHYFFADKNLSKNRSESFLLNIEPLK